MITKQLIHVRIGTDNRIIKELFVSFKNTLASIAYKLAAAIPKKHTFTIQLVSIAFRRPHLFNTNKDKKVETIKVITIINATITYRAFTP